MFQLELTNNGETWFTGISIHLIGGGYVPVIYRVGDLAPGGPEFNPTDTLGPIQQALDAWEANSTVHARGAIIMIHPNNRTEFNPEGTHLENLIMSYPAKLQGVGPGKDRETANDDVRGTQLDGGAFGAGILCPDPFNPPAQSNLFCDALARDAWLDNMNQKVTALTEQATIGNPALVEGSVLYVLSNNITWSNGPDGNGWTNEALPGGVDGCLITGGVQELGGIFRGPVTPGVPQNPPDVPQVTAVQGGGITLHSYTRFFRITNNGINANGGSYGGGVRVGTPFLNADGSGDSSNTELTISRNNIRYNGGFNLAGGIGLFGGSHDYVVERNHICGNNGQEYGGGISHFGSSNRGRIADNWILWNRAVDEGGGIIIATETTGLTDLPKDAGDVDIHGNLIQACVSGDDGGGLRFLNPGMSQYDVKNNIITHNVALHEGGGVSLNDAPFVKFHSNVVMNNLATGTSAESVRTELLAAGLATGKLSPLLLNRIDTIVSVPRPWDETIASYPVQNLTGNRVTTRNEYPWDFSHPLLFQNNIFWDNRASNGDAVGPDNSPTLQGLGLNVAAETWHLDMASSSGAKLEPIKSTVQNYGEYCPAPTTALPTIDGNSISNPIECSDDRDLDGTVPSYVGVPWGDNSSMSLIVRGWRRIPGLLNTNIIAVDATLLTSGPIGSYSFPVIPVQRGRRLSLLDEETVPEEEWSAPMLRKVDTPLFRSPSSPRGWLLLAVVLAAVTSFVVLKKTNSISGKTTSGTVEDQAEGKVDTESLGIPNKIDPAMNKKCKLHIFVTSLMLALRLSPERATAELVPYIHGEKYTEQLPVPPVIDLTESDYTNCVLNDTGNRATDIYMQEAMQDFGVKVSGVNLPSRILGYAEFNETDNATYPGPTILVTKNCPVEITFHNKLGTGAHIFDIDRSLLCGAELSDTLCTQKTTLDGRVLPDPPEGEDEKFYCRCVSANGSERRTTVHLHGAHVEPQYDGHPDSWYTDRFPDGTVDGGIRFSETGVNEANETVFDGTFNRYLNNQSAATLFFHDHAKGKKSSRVLLQLCASSPTHLTPSVSPKVSRG